MKSILLSIFTLVVFAGAGVLTIQAQDALDKSSDTDQNQIQQADSVEAQAVSGSVVINEIYGAGGCNTANCSAINRDYIELRNIGTTLAQIGGWSVQYASATGSTWQVITIPAGTTLRPGDTYLIGGSTNGASGTGATVLPTPNISTTLAMSGSAGKVALVNNNTPLAVACPTGNAGIIDFVGYGTTANCVEDPTGTTSGSSTLLAVVGGAGAAPPPTATTSIQRAAAGTDTDNNDVDFVNDAPSPTAALQPTAASATFAGRVVTADGQGVPRVILTVSDSSGTTIGYQTNGFGYFSFEGLRTGETYILNINSKQYRFEPATRAITLNQDLTDYEITAQP